MSMFQRLYYIVEYVFHMFQSHRYAYGCVLYVHIMFLSFIEKPEDGAIGMDGEGLVVEQVRCPADEL